MVREKEFLYVDVREGSVFSAAAAVCAGGLILEDDIMPDPLPPPVPASHALYCMLHIFIHLQQRRSLMMDDFEFRSERILSASVFTGRAGKIEGSPAAAVRTSVSELYTHNIACTSQHFHNKSKYITNRFSVY